MPKPPKSLTFDTTWKIPKNDLTLKIPVETSGIYLVSWGDNTSVETIDSKPAFHTFAKEGIYKIEMAADISHINFFDHKAHADKLESVDNWGAIKWTSMRNMFYYAKNMVYLAKDVPNLSQVNDMYSMFALAKSFNGNLSKWHLSNVTNMRNMFYCAISFNGDISNWDVGKVTDMGNMLYGATSFSILNYDKLLKKYSKQALKSNVILDCFSKYSISAKPSRGILTKKFHWKITDGGL